MTSFVPFDVRSSAGSTLIIRFHDCAWCRRRTKHGDAWIDADEHALRARRAHSSHGICPPCAAQERARLDDH